MNREDVTPLLLTFNEEANIGQALSNLAWAKRIVVVDSGSTDRTAEIAESFENTEFLVRPFDNHTSQWNFGLSLIRTNWVLTLDADYVCSTEFASEVNRLSTDNCVYYARFNYGVLGKKLRASLYPPRAVLFEAAKFHYVQDGHTQLLDTTCAQKRQLETAILHNDLKPLSSWVASQAKYAKLEAAKLSQNTHLGWKDWLRTKIILAPLLTLLYCLFLKGLLFNGWHGIYYTMQRVIAELLLSLELLDRRLRRSL